LIETLTALWPTFALIAGGFAARRSGFLPEPFWPHAERLTYFVLFPCLLVTSLASARLDSDALPMAAALIVALLVMTAIVATLRRPLHLSGPAYTSLVQGSIRFSTYLAVGATAALYGAPGLAIAAIAILAIVPTVNLISVIAFVRHASAAQVGFLGAIKPVAANPLIIGCLVGAILNLGEVVLPMSLRGFLEGLGRASVPLGLLAVGAGLAPIALRADAPAILAASVLKLTVLPGLTAAFCAAFAVDGLALSIAVLFTAMPAAPASYILARQLGGDARLMAAILTVQTVLAALSLPLALHFLT
jgi:malonate transporter and related proteins